MKTRCIMSGTAAALLALSGAASAGILGGGAGGGFGGNLGGTLGGNLGGLRGAGGVGSQDMLGGSLSSPTPQPASNTVKKNDSKAATATPSPVNAAQSKVGSTSQGALDKVGAKAADTIQTADATQAADATRTGVTGTASNVPDKAPAASNASPRANARPASSPTAAANTGEPAASTPHAAAGSGSASVDAQHHPHGGSVSADGAATGSAN